MTQHSRQYTKKVPQTADHGRTAQTFLLCVLCTCSLALVDSSKAATLDTSKDDWAIIAGYGQSIPGWGQTTERVQTIDLIPRYNHRIFDNIGSGWYRGFHSLLLEAPVSLVVSPDVAPMLGINFLAAYTFTAVPRWQPYFFGGGGPLYNFAEIPGMGADFNGNYQFGIGLKYTLAPKNTLLFELRYHHISNAGSEEPNVPLNSCKALLGFTF